MDFRVVINYFFFFFNVVSHGYEGTLIDVGNVFVIRENVICFPRIVSEYIHGENLNSFGGNKCSYHFVSYEFHEDKTCCI